MPDTSFSDTQTIPLKKGWNLVGTNLQDSRSIKEIFAGIATEISTYSNTSGKQTYNLVDDTGDLVVIPVNQGVWVKAVADGSVSFDGDPVAVDYSSLGEGLNITVPGSHTTPQTFVAAIESAVTNAVVSRMDVYIPETGWSFYDFSRNVGTLTSLHTGQGVWVKIKFIINNAPIASDDMLMVTENQTATGVLSASDAENNALTYTIVTNGSKGTVSITNAVTGAYSYAPNSDIIGIDTFTFKVNDGRLDSNVATISVDIAIISSSGISDQSIDEDISTKAIPFTVRAARVPLANLAIVAVSSNTTLVPNSNIVLGGSEADRTITIVPATNLSGDTTITITVADGSFSVTESFVLTVVAINDPPVASDLTFATDWKGSLDGVLFATDAEEDAFTYSVVTRPTKGTVMITDTATGAFTYTPNAEESGTDSFTYKVKDSQGGDSNVATVVIGDTFAPVIRTGQTSSYASGDDGALQKGVPWPDPRFTDHRDGTVTDHLTGLIWMQNGNCFGSLNWRVALIRMADLNTGTTTCPEYSGSDVDWRLPNRHELESLIDYGHYNPALPSGHSFTSVQSSYWSSSVAAGSSTSAWSVNIGGNGLRSTTGQSGALFVWPVRGGIPTTVSAPAPTMSVIADQSTDENMATSTIAFTVGANRTALDNLVIQANSSDTNLVPNANIVLGGTGADRTITLTPAVNLSGSTTIAVMVSDGLLSTTESFVLTVLTVNNPPVAVDQTFATDWRGSLNGTLAATDAEGDILIYSIATNPSKGSVIITDTATGAFTYTPNTEESGTDSFTYKVKDSQGGDSNVATLSIGDTFAPVIRTGQTSSYVTGDDGALQKGVPWPDPRFIDNGDGTVKDSLTGLVWMQNGNCWDSINWKSAFIRVADLNTKTAICTGYSGNHTDWRLPNRHELESLIDYGHYNPALPSGHPFTSVQSSYWSSSVAAGSSTSAWSVNIGGNGLRSTNAQSGGFFIWPVRGGIPATVATPAPTLSPIANHSTDEDVATAEIAFTVGATRTALDHLVIQATSSDTTLVPNANIVLSGSGADRAITLTPAANLSGSSTITVRMTDGVLSASMRFDLTVTAVNDTPVATDRTYATDWSGSLSGFLSATDVEGDTFTYAVVATPTKGTVNITDTTTGAFTYTPNSGVSGIDTFTYKARDGQDDSNVATLSIGDTFAPVIRTGQTSSYAVGDDGALKKGVPWPDPRFTNKGDGTIQDNLTGLIWMQNGNCFGSLDWLTALVRVANFNSGTVSCSDYSGRDIDWRLPNRHELESLIDYGHYNPALPSGHSFTSVQSSYWSSSVAAGSSTSAWSVNIGGNGLRSTNGQSGSFYVWPVRGGR